MTMLRVLLLLSAFIFTRVHAFDVYFDYKNNTFHVCVNAKSGTTSISHAIYESFKHSAYPKSCRQEHRTAHSFTCGFDEIPTFHKHEHQPSQVDYALMIVRHPIHRIVSSWRSKVRPDMCRVHGDKNVDSPSRNNLYKEWNTESVSFSQFVLERLDHKEAHWNPQFDLCHDAEYYDGVVDLETSNNTTFTPFSKALGIPFLMQHNHKSKRSERIKNGRKLRIAETKMNAVLERIYSFYSDDFKQYGFSKNNRKDMEFFMEEFSAYPTSCF